MAVSVGTAINLVAGFDFEMVAGPAPATPSSRVTYEVDAQAFNAAEPSGSGAHWGVMVHATNNGPATPFDRRGNRLWRNGLGLIFFADGRISIECWYNNSSCQRDAFVYNIRGALGTARYSRVQFISASDGYTSCTVQQRSSTSGPWVTVINQGGLHIVSTRRTGLTTLFNTSTLAGLSGVCTEIVNL